MEAEVIASEFQEEGILLLQVVLKGNQYTYLEILCYLSI